MDRVSFHRRLYRAFLSHAHSDKAIVDNLDAWLSDTAKIPIYYDAHNLPASATISTELADAISQCRSMLSIIGDDFREGQVQQVITEQISQAYMVIADISEGNLNSCIEAGIAIGTKSRLRLVTREPRDRTPYMLSNQKVLSYANDADLLGIIHQITFPYRRRILNSELA